MPLLHVANIAAKEAGVPAESGDSGMANTNVMVIRSAMYPGIVLTLADDGVTVVTGWFDPTLTDTTQQWVRYDSAQNFRLVNVSNGGGMTANSIENGAGIQATGDGDQWNP